MSSPASPQNPRPEAGAGRKTPNAVTSAFPGPPERHPRNPASPGEGPLTTAPIAPRNLAALPAALPFQARPEGALRAVLLIHGYTGSPLDMRFLADRLADAGFAVSLPRLPGAGTEMTDLAASNRRDWRRRVYDAWLDLRAEFDDISVVGYSMGGLLALDLAAAMRPDRIILLAPALVASSGIVPFTPYIAPFAGLIPEIGTSWSPEKEENPDARAHGRRYWVRRDVRSLAQFARLQKEVRRKLGSVEAPVYLASSDDDDTVNSPRSRASLETGLSRGLAGALELTGCRHDVPQGVHRENVAKAVIGWLA